MWLFHFLFWTTVTVSAKEQLYGKIGDKAVLTPDSVVNRITSIQWKHGLDIAMDWYGDEIFSYRHFKDRGMLNTLTGALTITGLTRDDSGNYTVEINDNIATKTELLVISPVPKPTVSVRCEPEMTYCVLTCNGSTTGAEPVTYRWTSDEITLSSTKEHKITKENKEPWFSCAFENPVSFNSSEKVSNPFISDRTWIFILIALVFIVCIIIIIIIIIYFRCKGRKRKAADGTEEEKTQMLQADQNTSTQDTTSVVTKDPSNGTVISTISEVHETPNQDQETAESPETSNESERSATSPEVPKTSTEDQDTAESPDTSNETETNNQRNPCWYYNKGGCRNGDRCPYQHVCKYAMKGNCQRGSNCKLKHPGGTKPQWQYKRNRGGWHEFRHRSDTTECSVNSDDIERKYQQNPKTKMPFTVNRNYYELDFEAMIQTNLVTKHSHKIRRVLV